jgi:hypothetical protein
MAEATSTRKELRRVIARAARLEFFRRYSANEVALTGTPTTTSLTSSSLTQVASFWQNAWAYVVDGTQAGAERKVTAFDAVTDALTLEYALAGAPAAGVMIELYDTWSAADIHDAINRAIREWGRIFFDSVMDQTLILKEDTMEYSLTSLVKRVWSLRKVRIEQAGNSITGLTTSASVVGSHVQLVQTAMFKTNDQYNGYKISIYDGTGAGQVGDVVDTVATGTYITVLATQFATTPDSTSKFRLWLPSEQLSDTWPLANWRTDSPEFPDYLILNKLEPSFYGMRMYLYYTHVPTELTADADTTVVPKEFIVNQALAYLHESMMGDNRSDANRHANIAQVYRNLATEYRERFGTRQPATMVQVEDNLPYGAHADYINPLGWGE